MAADFKKGDRVLVHAVNEDGKVLKRTWYVATITSVGRGRQADTYRVTYDDNETERVPKSDIYGKTPIKRKRISPIKGRQIDKWRPEAEKDKRLRLTKSKGLTARQILRIASEPDKTNSAYVRVERKEIRKKKERGPDGEEYWTQISRTKTAPAGPNDVARRHYQRIDILDPAIKDIKTKGARLKLSCDCERWKYVWEYAMTKRYKAADIIYGNGDPPTVTNKSLSAGVCKHLFALLERGR